MPPYRIYDFVVSDQSFLLNFRQLNHKIIIPFFYNFVIMVGIVINIP